MLNFLVDNKIFTFAVPMYLLFFGTWLFYIAFMGLKQHLPMLKEDHYLLYCGVLPFFILAYAMDILFNIIIATLFMFYEIPREWTFSERILRHQKFSNGWRLERANYFCHVFLKPFDKKHCL